MADAVAGIADGAVSGDIFMAGHQTAGRGRLPGRVWDDRPDNSLLVTLVLPAVPLPSETFPLSLTAGLAVARTLESHDGLGPRIKWPNDVYVAGRKISGILVESTGAFTLLGLGVNLNQDFFPPELERRAVSLKMVSGRETDPRDWLGALLPVLKGYIDREIAGDRVSLREEMNALLLGRGERVRFLAGHPDQGDLRNGILRGISEEGALLLEEGERLQTLYSGEILYQG